MSKRVMCQVVEYRITHGVGIVCTLTCGHKRQIGIRGDRMVPQRLQCQKCTLAKRNENENPSGFSGSADP